MRKIFVSCLVVFAFIVAAYSPALAQETIPSYEHIISLNSEIKLSSNGDILVKEQITVYAQNQTINHGIYRDYPLKERLYWVLQKYPDFELISVKRDGKKEPYHTTLTNNGIRIYMGSEEYYVSPGIHKYELEYRVSEQIRFFEEYDEFYHNLVGNYWEYEISQYSSVIEFPKEIPVQTLDIEGYSGERGEVDTDYYYNIDQVTNTVAVQTSRPYKPGEGLTFSFSWDKGLVSEPTQTQKILTILDDNWVGFLAFGLMSGLLLYYFLIWILFGRDPKSGVKYPLYEAPENLSPAAIRFLNNMKHDDFVVTAALISMAVKGFIRIEKINKSLKLHKLKKADNKLSDDEKVLFEHLFGGAPNTYNFSLFGKQIFSYDQTAKETDTLMLTQSNSTIIAPAVTNFKEHLSEHVGKSNFNTHGWLIFIGVIWHILIVLFVIGNFIIKGYDPNEADGFFFLIFTAIWNGITSFLLLAVVSLWYSYFTINRSWKALTGAFALTLFAIPFVATGIGTFIAAAINMGPFLPLSILVPIYAHYLIVQPLKVRTVKGRMLQDKIEGFKMFLLATERERVQIMHRELPKTLETYEKYLPYAVALGIEAKWTAEFKDELAKAQLEEKDHSAFGWYAGSISGMTAGSIAGSISSSISASVATSSGSGGSGSSGGGGGGGGGGGW